MSTHDGKTLNCYGPPDGPDHDARPLTFEDHGRFVRSPPRSEGFESSALRFDCPECGRTLWVCPVCSDQLHDDPEGRVHQAPGWFYGESTGEALACHNCNQAEAARQMREPTPRRPRGNGDEDLGPEAFL